MSLRRQGSSASVSTPITGFTEKILSFNFDWGSKALLVVKGNALLTLPSSSYHGGFCVDSKMKARQKKNNIGFLFLLYTTALKTNFRTSINSLEVSVWFFLRSCYQHCLYHVDTDTFMYTPRAGFWAVTDSLC